MAGCDKTWGNKQQFIELLTWLQANIPEFSAWLIYEEISEVEDFSDDEIFNIANTATWVDMYMLANCEVEWFVEYILVNMYSWMIKDKSKTVPEHIAENTEEDHQYLLEEYAKQVERFGEPETDLSEEETGAYNLFLQWKSRGYTVKPECLAILEKIQLKS